MRRLSPLSARPDAGHDMAPARRARPSLSERSDSTSSASSLPIPHQAPRSRGGEKALYPSSDACSSADTPCTSGRIAEKRDVVTRSGVGRRAIRPPRPTRAGGCRENSWRPPQSRSRPPLTTGRRSPLTRHRKSREPDAGTAQQARQRCQDPCRSDRFPRQSYCGELSRNGMSQSRADGSNCSMGGTTLTSFSRCTTPRLSSKPQAALACAVTTKCAIGLKRDMRTCSHASSRSAS
jgi:hypothetical protein